MHVDLHKRVSKLSLMTYVEKIPWYYPLHYQFSATSCMQYHVLNAFSELCKQYSIACSCSTQLFGTKES